MIQYGMLANGIHHDCRFVVSLRLCVVFSATMGSDGMEQSASASELDAQTAEHHIGEPASPILSTHALKPLGSVSRPHNLIVPLHSSVRYTYD